jgi:hypothetical protein
MFVGRGLDIVTYVLKKHHSFAITWKKKVATIIAGLFLEL